MAASSLGFERALPAAHRFRTWRLFYFLRRALYGALAAPPSYAGRRLARRQVLCACGPSGNTDPRGPLPRTETGNPTIAKGIAVGLKESMLLPYKNAAELSDDKVEQLSLTRARTYVLLQYEIEI
ncbi:hypothetical protein NDU88_005995 [Pleurodeles waltl]|uniref:Uncharacterized protein n=1 Tax=Pleurodeles waltl TaxID=8319 RepID=A0AAV7NT41_PLEWA|nr:hypothetical protein NDU88_005995 [Pleurodeles waltl]